MVEFTLLFLIWLVVLFRWMFWEGTACPNDAR